MEVQGHQQVDVEEETMSESALQQQFAQDAALLIQKAKLMGYAVTFGEAWRTPQQAEWNAQHGTGIVHSLHIERLAIDLNVFVDGVYQTDDSSGCYSTLGIWWKNLSPNHRFGGDFTSKDWNHFSLSPDGIRG